MFTARVQVDVAVASCDRFEELVERAKLDYTARRQAHCVPLMQRSSMRSFATMQAGTRNDDVGHDAKMIKICLGKFVVHDAVAC